MFNLDFLAAIRAAEVDELATYMLPGSRVLEFGAGTGEQAKMLSDRGFDVVAIDLVGSSYAGNRMFPVTDYDGVHIPLPDQSVDVIFSSNVLEHVEDLGTTMREFRRILKQSGVGVHAMPTPAWRLWTFVAGVPTALEAAALIPANLVKPPSGSTRTRALGRNLKTLAGSLLPVGHGTSPEGISELWTFSRRAWRNLFANNGFEVVEDRPVGVFYTGHMLMGRHLSFDARRKLSRYLGSAARIYVVRAAGREEPSSP
jgi:SAM-dependent methyltransferase